MSLPNLFSFATSELSQDAFICWLLSWASPEHNNTDESLHQCSVGFIQALFEKHSKKAPSKLEKIEISKQDNSIDVLCIINGKYAILIEDKTWTKSHSNQLERYFEDIKKRSYKAEDILPIYFKTEDQGDYSDVLDKGYKLFLRSDFLDILSSYTGSNAIILDYRNHLRAISDNVESYESLPIEKWEWYSWVGFYLRLQKELGSGNWDYVANPNGGFLCFWWHFQGDNGCQQYLQLEQNKFCFRISVNNFRDRSRLRSKWHKIITAKGTVLEYGLNLVKPSRFGNGQSMTVCIYNGEYRECDSNNIIDVGKTIQRLKAAEALLDAVGEKA